MKWLNRFSDSLTYIEENLRGEVDVDVVAKKACLSKFYYYRMFQIVTGRTLGEYIRNRKMSLAASELKSTERRIIDIALDYGYGSQEAFSRAFKSVHDLTPAQARKEDTTLKAYPPISFQLQLKGDVEMNYRIEKKDAFNVLGVSKKVSSVNGENYKIVPAYWQQVGKDGTFKKIMEQADAAGCYGICMNYNDKEEIFDYVIGVRSDREGTPFQTFRIPESTYAVFGPVKLEALQDTWKRIFSEWLPATEYELSDVPEIEYYPPTEDGSVISEIWMPIKK